MSKTDETNTFLTNEEIDALVNHCSTLKKSEIKKFYLKPFSENKLGYQGDHKLLTIDVCERDGDSEVPKSLTFFAKTLMPDSNVFEKMVFQEEFTFYAKAMAQLMDNFRLEHWAADCLLAKENIIVLEDLKSRGFKVIDGQLSIDHLKAAMASVARFHASSIILEKKLQQPLCDVYEGYFKQKSFRDTEEYSLKWLLTGIEVVETIAGELHINPEYAKIAYDMVIDKIKPTIEGRNLLCHMDLWSNNLMFKGEKEISCRLVDFQMSFYTCYAIDLVQLIYLNITRSMRQTYEKELIEVYHEVLTKALRMHKFEDSEIISLEEVIQDFEKKRIIGLVTAAQYFPISLLNKEFVEEFTESAESMDRYKFISRKNFVLKAMKVDFDYRKRNEEAVRELIEYMKTISK